MVVIISGTNQLPIRLSSRPDYSDSIEHGGRTPEGAIVFEVAAVALVPGEQWKELRSGPSISTSIQHGLLRDHDGQPERSEPPPRVPQPRD